MVDKFCKVSALENSETSQWWEYARAAYENHPESVPDGIYPLVDTTWGDTEVMVTRAELKFIQSWAIGLPGWSERHPALSFKI